MKEIISGSYLTPQTKRMEIFKYKKINKISEKKNKGSLGFFFLHRADDSKVICRTELAMVR